MPSFDTISEWVLANLYLVGAVAGVLLLVVLLVLLRAAGRRRDEGVLMEGYEVTYAGLDTFDDADLAAPEIDLITPPQMIPGGGETYDVVDDVVANEDPFAYDDVATDDPSAVVAAPPTQIAGRAYLPPTGPRGNHTRDIVQGLLSGQGDMTSAELRRLDLLRPEKVLEVADELEAGLHGRGEESERARLARIRQHAHLLLPGGADLADEQALTPEQAVTPEQAPEQALTPERTVIADHPDPVIGEAVAIGPTLEPVYEREHEPGPVEGFPGPERGDRAEALHSLAPAELGRRFSETDDKIVKLSIIDALEDTAGPESISVLQVCLDDPDSEVQLHALEAAERLLAQR